MSQLVRRITPFTLLMVSINAIIGSGWLFAPFYAAKIAGPEAIYAWLIGGFATMLIAFTYAEISTLLPVSGGTAHITQMTHGSLVSFILSWTAWISSVIMTPIEVQAVLQYSSLFMPTIIKEGTGGGLSLFGFGMAFFLMLFLSVLNIVSYRVLMRFNFILCVFKFSIILLTIFFIMKTRFHLQNFAGWNHSLTHINHWQSIFTAIATSGIVLAFNGFKSGVELAGEAKNLALAIPLSTIGSVLTCLLLYLALQICFIGALSPDHIHAGWQHLNFQGDIGPFLGLSSALGLYFLMKLLYANAIVSPLGAGLVYVTSGARIIYAMSKIGYVPKIFSKLNKQHFPMIAIVFNTAIGMLSFLPLPGWQSMVNFLVSVMIISYAMGPISLLCLRANMPKEHRPFKLKAANLFCFLAFYSCNLFIYWTGWETISKLSFALLVGFILLLLSNWRGDAKITKQEIFSGVWLIPYFSGLILISYLGAYEGKNIIPFGLDFLVLGVFSLLMLMLAIKSRLKSDSQASFDELTVIPQQVEWASNK